MIRDISPPSGPALIPVLSGPDALHTMLKLIDHAVRDIHLQVYIFKNDLVGKKIAASLIHAAQRGVNVYVLVDSFGSMDLNTSFVERLKKKGLHFAWFSPFFTWKNFYAGRRLHHKVLIIDGSKAFISGINIGNEYLLSTKYGYYPWLDFGIVAEGPFVKKIFLFCIKLFCKSSPEENPELTKLMQTEPLKTNQTRRSASTSMRNINIQIHDWFRGFHEIGSEYIKEITSSQKNILIVSGYFLPGKRFLKRIAAASKRGVKVELILPGLSDVRVIKWAIDYLYTYLLKNHVTIYEWRESVLHAKAAIIDDRWVTTGSYNLDFISHFSNIETNIMISDEMFAKQVKDIFLTIIKRCKHNDPKKFSQKKFSLPYFRSWLCYHFVRLLIGFASYFLPKNISKRGFIF